MAARRKRRLDGPTANEQLLDDAIAHALTLERLKTGEARKLGNFVRAGLLLELEKRLEGRLRRIRSRGYDRGPWVTQQYRDALATLRALSQGIWKVAEKRTVATLTEIGQREVSWQARAIERAVPFEVSLGVPNLSDIRTVIHSRPMHNRFLADWFKSASASTSQGITEVINGGFARGDSVPQMVRGMRRVLDRSRQHAETIVRTGVSHTSSVGREILYDDNDDIISGAQWVATLDTRTSVICAGLDNEVFPPNEGPRPPAHPNCRSTTVPVLKSVEEILGARAADKQPSGVRASMDGQVPADTSFSSWLGRQTEARQNAVLGKTRADLFRQGKIELKGLVDSQLRPLTLDQIRTR